MIVERRVIKGSPKSYVRQSDDKKITKCSRYITLGVNCSLNKGDKAVILREDDYNSLVNNTVNDSVVNELKEELSNKEDNIKQLTDKVNELLMTNNKLSNDIDKLTDDVDRLTDDNTKLSDDIDKLNNDLSIKEDGMKDLNTKLANKEDEISIINRKLAKYTAYDMEELLTKSKELESLKYYYIGLQSEKIEYKDVINYLNSENTLLKKRGILQRIFNKDVTTDIDKPTLKLIDLQGNSLDKSNDNSNDIISKKSPNSE